MDALREHPQRLQGRFQLAAVLLNQCGGVRLGAASLKLLDGEVGVADDLVNSLQISDAVGL